MASSAKNLVEVAKSLPAPLQRFLARWPPAAILPEGHKPTPFQIERPNPFAFHKNPDTGSMQDPVYSQRRQAELVKLAREHGVEELLPETNKRSDTRIAKRVELGLRVKGTGVGQKVKGRIHERHMIGKYVIPRVCLPGAEMSLAGLVAYRLLTYLLGWKRGEEQCWICQGSSSNGKG